MKRTSEERKALTREMSAWARKTRETLDLSQGTVSTALGYGSVTILNRIEHHQRNSVQSSLWEKLCKFYEHKGSPPYQGAEEVSLASRLHSARKRLGVSAQVFGKNVKLTGQTILRLEAGDGLYGKAAGQVAAYLDELEALPGDLVKTGDLPIIPPGKKAEKTVVTKPVSVKALATTSSEEFSDERLASIILKSALIIQSSREASRPGTVLNGVKKHHN